MTEQSPTIFETVVEEGEIEPQQDKPTEESFALSDTQFKTLFDIEQELRKNLIKNDLEDGEILDEQIFESASDLNFKCLKSDRPICRLFSKNMCFRPKCPFRHVNPDGTDFKSPDSEFDATRAIAEKASEVFNVDPNRVEEMLLTPWQCCVKRQQRRDTHLQSKKGKNSQRVDTSLPSDTFEYIFELEDVSSKPKYDNSILEDRFFVDLIKCIKSMLLGKSIADDKKNRPSRELGAGRYFASDRNNSASHNSYKRTPFELSETSNIKRSRHEPVELNDSWFGGTNSNFDSKRTHRSNNDSHKETLWDDPSHDPWASSSGAFKSRKDDMSDANNDRENSYRPRNSRYFNDDSRRLNRATESENVPKDLFWGDEDEPIATNNIQNNKNSFGRAVSPDSDLDDDANQHLGSKEPLSKRQMLLDQLKAAEEAVSTNRD